jgi:hypothetical protein
MSLHQIGLPELPPDCHCVDVTGLAAPPQLVADAWQSAEFYANKVTA